jgi:hypothetical protein
MTPSSVPCLVSAVGGSGRRRGTEICEPKVYQIAALRLGAGTATVGEPPTMSRLDHRTQGTSLTEVEWSSARQLSTVTGPS